MLYFRVEFSWQVIEIVTKHFKNTMQRDYLQEKHWLQQSLPMDQIVIYKININKLQFFDQTKNTTYFLFLIIIKLKFIINHFFFKKIMAKCSTVRHRAAQCDIVQYCAALFFYLATRCGTLRHRAALFFHLATRCGTLWHLVALYGTVPHYAALYFGT